MAVSANNSWVDSYLEALLSYGLSSEYSKSPTAEKTKSEKVDADRQLYAKYYVSQIMQMGEEGIRDAWNKATSAKHYGEKDARLEYLSWRVWFMKRNRALAKEERRRRAALLAEEGSSVTVQDEETSHDGETSDEETLMPVTSTGSKGISFDLEKKASLHLDKKRAPSLPKVTEGQPFHEKKALKVDTKPKDKDRASVDFLASEYASTPRMAEPHDDRDPFEGRVDGLYLVLISLHGLVRGDRMELGKDPDTGGQVKYVVELARAIAQHPAVYRVDLLTRLIQDPNVDPSYGEPEECIWKAPDEKGLGGAYIERLACGPPKKYLRKEKLWPHIREFADRAIAHTRKTAIALGEAGTPCELYAVHGHYADAGEVAALMSSTLGIDMVMTGHSLGRNKLEHLLGTMTKKEIEDNYAISRRIEAEERALETATMVLTSTQQEIDEQWGLYDGYDVKLEAVLRARRRAGRMMPLINVIPPGLDFSSLKVDLPMDPAQGAKPPPKHASFSAHHSNPCSPRSADGSSPHGEPRLSDVGSPVGEASLATPDPMMHMSSAGSAGPSMFQPFPPLPKSPFASPCGSPKGADTCLPTPSHHKGSGPCSGKCRANGKGTVAAGREENNNKVARQTTGQGFYPFLKEEPQIWREIFRFLKNPRKPAILAMSRPDAKKNITTLVKAFGEDPTLRELANLVLIMGNRDNIDSMAGGSQKILNQVLKLIDQHDLYGSVAYPKKHQQKDISDIYLLPFATRGIFTNVALQEPFGLTVIEAAAHGVPTVATKNGGPVDIMATLHHGLLVDPTNSKQIADALIRILTNSQVWDEMSQNGVGNIMAYSWFSHCEKYLKALEFEKRFMKKQKRFQSRLSGNWDTKSFLVDGEKPGAANSAQAQEEFLRRGSVPTGPKSRTGSQRPMQVRQSATGPASGRSNARPIDERRPSSSPHAADDAVLLGHPSGEGDAREHPVGYGRKRFALVVLDGEFRVPAVAPVITQLVSARNKAGADDLGIGVASMSGFSSTFKALQEADVTVGDLDWMICNGGADIWQLLPEHDGKETTWVADEQWEGHISFRWDRDPLARAVTKLVSNDRKETMASAPTLQKALTLMTDQQEAQHVHPNHIMIPLNSETKSVLDMGPRATGKEAVATVVVDKMRRRMRQNGYHAHITLQMAVEDGQMQANVHITPMRASRALALRYLATKFSTDTENIAVVAVSSELQVTGEVTKATSFTSDLIELVSGVCPVTLIGLPQEQGAAGKASKSDSYAIDKMSIRVSPKVFGARIRCLSDKSMDEIVNDIINNNLASGYEGVTPSNPNEDDD